MSSLLPFAAAAAVSVSLALSFAGEGKSGGVEPSAHSVYDFTVKDIDGSDVSLAQYKGDVLLIVNVASR